MTMNGTITLVSNKDSGRITKPTITGGMTLKELLAAELGIVDPDHFQFVVNGAVVPKTGDRKLKTGDFVVISPTNVKGN